MLFKCCFPFYLITQITLYFLCYEKTFWASGENKHNTLFWQLAYCRFLSIFLKWILQMKFCCELFNFPIQSIIYIIYIYILCMWTCPQYQILYIPIYSFCVIFRFMESVFELHHLLTMSKASKLFCSISVRLWVRVIALSSGYKYMANRNGPSIDPWR